MKVAVLVLLCTSSAFGTFVQVHNNPLPHGVSNMFHSANQGPFLASVNVPQSISNFGAFSSPSVNTVPFGSTSVINPGLVNTVPFGSTSVINSGLVPASFSSQGFSSVSSGPIVSTLNAPMFQAQAPVVTSGPALLASPSIPVSSFTSSLPAIRSPSFVFQSSSAPIIDQGFTQGPAISGLVHSPGIHSFGSHGFTSGPAMSGLVHSPGIHSFGSQGFTSGPAMLGLVHSPGIHSFGSHGFTQGPAISGLVQSPGIHSFSAAPAGVFTSGNFGVQSIGAPAIGGPVIGGTGFGATAFGGPGFSAAPAGMIAGGNVGFQSFGGPGIGAPVIGGQGFSAVPAGMVGGGNVGFQSFGGPGIGGPGFGGPGGFSAPPPPQGGSMFSNFLNALGIGSGAQGGIPYGAQYLGEQTLSAPGVGMSVF